MDYLCYKLSEIDEIAVNTSVLTDKERQMSRPRRIARALLRHEISRRTGIAPAEIIFSYNTHGKPGARGVHFNISHSADFVCMAFHQNEVGVDIQQKRKLTTISKLAPRIMCSEQLEQFWARGGKEDEFYTCWCIAEALVKLHGSTIWHAHEYPFVLFDNRVTYTGAPAVTINLFQPHPGYWGAVAYRLST